MLARYVARLAAVITVLTVTLLAATLLIRPAAETKVLVGDAGWNRYDAAARIAWTDPNPPRLRAEHISRSPSGRYTVLSDERGERARVIIRDHATGDTRTVEPDLRVPPYTRFLDPVWVPGTERMLTGILTNDAPAAPARSLVMELNAATGEVRIVADLTERTGVIYSVQFDAARTRAALLTYEGNLFIWDRTTDEIITSLALVTPGQGRWAGSESVVVGQGPCLWVVDAATGSYDERVCVEGLRRFAVSPDATTVAVAWARPNRAGGLHLIDLAEGTQQPIFTVTGATPSSGVNPREIAWSRDGRYVYAGFDLTSFGDAKYLVDTANLSFQPLPRQLVEFLSWETDAQLACAVGRACG